MNRFKPYLHSTRYSAGNHLPGGKRSMLTRYKLGLFLFLIVLILSNNVAFPTRMENYSLASTLDNETSPKVFLRDGFENNTARRMIWTDKPPVGWMFNDISTENGAYIELSNDTSEAYQGNFSCRIFAPHSQWLPRGNPAYNINYSYWNPTYSNIMFGFGRNMTDIYVRWYQKFENLPLENWEVFSIFYLIGKGYVTNMEVSIIRINNQINVMYNKLWGAGASSNEFGTRTIPVNMTTNRWYCFEIWYKSDSIKGEYRAWFEGKEILRLINLDTTPRGARPYLPDSFDIGILTSGKYHNYTSWIDDVVAADTRVGPEGWAPPNIDLTIQVLDNRSRSPVPNAQVELASYTGYTNESGFVTFADVPTFSKYIATISKHGYQRLQELECVTDITPILQISIEPIPHGLGALIVSTTYKGKSIPAQLEIVGNGTTISSTTPLIVNLHPGIYELNTHHGPGIYMVKAHTTISVEEGQTSLANLEFPLMKGLLEIRVYSNSVPISVPVEIIDEGGTTRASRSPCEVLLMPGIYVLKSGYAYQTRTYNVTILETKDTAIQLRFQGPLSFFLDEIIRLSLIVLGAGGGLLIGIDFIRRYRINRRHRPLRVDS